MNNYPLNSTIKNIVLDAFLEKENRDKFKINNIISV